MAKSNRAGQPKVAVVILNYRVWPETLRCVRSVLNSTYKNVLVLVIDNHSPDDSVKQLTRRLPKSVNFIAHNQNAGYAGGNNLGLKWALKKGAAYVLILNPDTVVAPRAIGELVKFAESPAAAKVGFLGPRIFYPNKTIYSDGGDISWTLTKATLRRHGHSPVRRRLARAPFACGYITGTALFARSRVIKAIGLMREEFFLYYEDTDWSLRCRRAGYKLMIVPAAVVCHEGYKSTGLLSESYIYYHTRNGLYLAFWNGSLLIRILAIALSVIKLLKQPVKYILKPKQRAWVKPVVWGIIDAWRGVIGQYQP